MRITHYSEAFKWYMKSAEKGYGSAQGRVGVMLEGGIGTPVNKPESEKWIEKARAKGVDMESIYWDMMF